MVDLFIRPEQLRVVSAGEAGAFTGTVAASIYQGGHVDLYIDAPEIAATRVLMRLNASDGAAAWSNGAKIEIGIGGNDAVAFPQPGV